MKRILALVLIGLLITTNASAWTVDGLEYTTRKKITIQTTNVGADQTDFPLLVYIDADGDIGDSNADGYDIRFTEDDGSTLLKYERESWSGGGGGAVTANIWVKTAVTTVGTGATDIYVYYRDTDTADGEDATNVWDANFVAVWHLNTDDFTDSTGTHNATNQGSDNIAGKIAGGKDFVESSTDYIEVPIHADFRCAQPTVEYWTKPGDTANYYEATFSIGKDTNDRWVLQFFNTQDYTTIWNDINNSGVRYTSSKDIIDGNWHYVAVTITTATGSIIYVDGASTLSSGTAAAKLGFDALPSDSTIYIGAATASAGGPENYFDGIIDEVRFSNIPRSLEWQKFTYYNVNEADNELDWGDEEVDGGAAGVIKTYNGLAWASIKTINGLAVASVKTINSAAAQ